MDENEEDEAVQNISDSQYDGAVYREVDEINVEDIEVDDNVTLRSEHTDNELEVDGNVILRSEHTDNEPGLDGGLDILISAEEDAPHGTIVTKDGGVFALSDTTLKRKKKLAGQCHICNKNFYNLSQHMTVHSENRTRKQKCHICVKAFYTKQALKFHLETHPVQKPYRCADCGKAFHSQICLKAHTRNYHSGAHLCSFCGKTLPSYGSLNRHLQIHTNHERKYKCDICGKSFGYSNVLKDHKRIHTGERPWSCDVCGQRFKQGSAKRSHMRNVHNSEKNFECTICNRKFANGIYLGRHMVRIHSGNAPQFGPCTFCGKMFTTKRSLEAHTKIHTGDCRCVVCGKGFSNRRSLQNHLKTYKGRKPFRCGHCGRFFHNQLIAKKHIMQHVVEEEEKLEKDKTSKILTVEVFVNIEDESESEIEEEITMELSDQSPQMEIIGIPEPEHELPDEARHKDSHLEYNERETVTDNRVTNNIEDSDLVSGNLFEPMNDFTEVHFGVEFDANGASLHYEDNGKTGILIVDDEAEDGYILTIAEDGDFNSHEDIVDVSLDVTQSTIKNAQITQLLSPRRKVNEGSKQICEKCGKTTTNMTSHKNTHCNTPIDCAVCGKTFCNKGSYYYHIKTHEERKFGCSICGKRYITKTQLRYHMEGHTIKTSYQCPQCPKQFTAVSSLRLHTRIHTGEKPYPCRICGQQFRHTNARIDHERRHTGERPHVCSVCGKAFTQRSSLRSHWHMHTTEKNFECEICGKKFARKNGLGQHRKRHAQDRKMFECEICGLECTAADGLKKHMKLHNKLNCSGCRRKFDTKEELEKHEKHYEGRKPSSCGVCGRMFHYRMSALRHMNTHTGNRSREFHCEVCDGMFQTERQLKVHKERFDGQKPYKCGHCGKNFHVQYVAKRHVLYHLKRVIKETTQLKSIEKSSLS